MMLMLRKMTTCRFQFIDSGVEKRRKVGNGVSNKMSPHKIYFFLSGETGESDKNG